MLQTVSRQLDPATGKPMMQKKVVPAAPVADAVSPAVAAMDASLTGSRNIRKFLHKALGKRAAHRRWLQWTRQSPQPKRRSRCFVNPEKIKSAAMDAILTRLTGCRKRLYRIRPAPLGSKLQWLK